METRATPAGADLLAIALAGSVLMWDIGFVGRIPGMVIEGRSLMGLLLLALLAVGLSAGRWSGRGWVGGLLAGALCQTINLLVIGALLDRPATGLEHVPVVGHAAAVPHTHPLPWLLGSLAVGGLLGAVGGLIGARWARPLAPEAWRALLVAAIPAAAFSTIILGGLVTGLEVGMAVLDWPTTGGQTMWLYPLSRMTGGIYYEHAHRLMGSLVGLASLIVTAHLLWTERRRDLRLLTVFLLLLICVQGLLGGLRVRYDSLHLAATHGVLGQVTFGMAILLLARATAGWPGRATRPVDPEDAPTRGAVTGSWLLVAAIVLQISLGAVVRHLGLGDSPLYLHIFGAVLLIMFAGPIAGLALTSAVPQRRLGGGLIAGLIFLQLCLGFASLITVRSAGSGHPPLMVITTTLHQSFGALLLGAAVWTACFTHADTDEG